MPSLNLACLKSILAIFLCLTLFSCSSDKPASGTSPVANGKAADGSAEQSIDRATGPAKEEAESITHDAAVESEVADAVEQTSTEATAVPGSAKANANADIVSLYQKTCIACHLSGAAGAPRSHDSNAWTPRMSKGMAALVKNVKDGFNAMPAKGACFNCTDEQFEALVEFMAGPKP